MLSHQPRGLIDLVFRAFSRLQQRILASCHQQQQPVLRPVEGWDKLGAILDCEPTGRSGTNINQSAIT